MITNDVSLLESVKSEEYIDIDNIYALIPIEIRLHMQRVNSGCRLLAELMLEMDMEEEGLEAVVKYSDKIFRYHDIGYGFLPVKSACNIKCDNGILNDNIFDIKKFFELDNISEGMLSKHAKLGKDAFEMPLFRYKNDDIDKLSSQVATYHHEKWDGTGYPMGLKEREIPLAARICAVIDMYDMFSEYFPCTKEGKNNNVIEALTQVSGDFLQPELVEGIKENADIFFEPDMECGNVRLF